MLPFAIKSTENRVVKCFISAFTKAHNHMQAKLWYHRENEKSSTKIKIIIIINNNPCYNFVFIFCKEHTSRLAIDIYILNNVLCETLRN